MKIQNSLVLFVYFFNICTATSLAVAASPSSFASEKACFDYFKKSTGKSDIVAAEVFCKSKYVKSAIDICAEKKLLNFKMKNSISSVDEPKYSLKFKNECATELASQKTSANSKVIAQSLPYQNLQNQVTSQISPSNPQTAPSDGAANTRTQTGNQNSSAATTSIATEVVPPPTATPQALTPQQLQQQAQIKAQIEAQQNAQKTATANAEKQSKDDDGDSSFMPMAAGGLALATIGVGLYNSINENKENLKKNIKETKESGENLIKIMPETKPAVDKLNNESSKDFSNFFAPKSEISTETNALAQIKSVVSEGISSLESNPNDANFYIKNALKKFEVQAVAYEASKKTCTSKSELSSLLCIEGTSPVATASRTLIDLAGPILGVINTAQKACSSTAKVTDLAAKGLTVAKGLCVGAKLYCDYQCGSAAKDLALLQTELGTVKGAVMANGAAIPIFTKLETIVAAESQPTTAGTALYAAAKCNENGKDIALFATNILGLVAAKMSAKDCDKKLSSSNNPTVATNITPDQFCNTPENSETQFCKCKNNSQQMGCPGYVSSTSDSRINTVAGTNLKNSGSGLNNFANGKKTNAVTSDNQLNNQNDQDPTQKNSMFGGLSSGQSSSSGNTDSNSSDLGNDKNTSHAKTTAAGDAEAQKSQDNKKWSFEGFASSMSGFFGGKSGSRKSNGDSSDSQQGLSGNSAQKALIQRKLASDKLAAQITSETGKSNWEKVHRVYTIKENTLLSER